VIIYNSRIFKKDKKSDLSFTIWECYVKEPNVDARKAIERLCRIVPREFLEGLGGVLLWDTEKLKEYWGDTEKVSTARYVRLKDGSKDPWIEICIDRVFHGFPKWVLKFSVITDLMLSPSFYHEIGHHIDRKSGNNGENAEKEAEKWAKNFGSCYWLRYHFFFIALMIIVFPIGKQLAKMCRNKQSE
jgi:hypothetical protein